MIGAVIGTGNGSTFAVPMRPQWLRAFLPPGRSGVYVLVGNGVPRYVGRSDACLLAHLCTHELRSEASHVMWRLSADRLHAYRAECYWYHTLNDVSLLNRVHPASPAGVAADCVFCGSSVDHAIEAVGALASVTSRSRHHPPKARPELPGAHA